MRNKVLAFALAWSISLSWSWTLSAQYSTVVFRMKIVGEMADLLGPMMPQKMIVRSDGGNARITLEGGMAASMMGDILYLEKKDETFMLRDKEKTAYKMPKNSDVGEVKPEVTPLGEENVNGYECKKYKVVLKTEEGSIDQTMWTTTAIPIPKPKRNTTGGSGAGLFLQEVEGYPVKVEQSLQRMGLQLQQTIELERFDTQPLDAALFQLPDNYKIKDFDPGMFGGMR
ncbi:MAG: DUF4412 domain-containing protein [Flavobacteriales bacterium]|nr:DUF4412 domain-containing protein [Flavobacteriales bacterium]